MHRFPMSVRTAIVLLGLLVMTPGLSRSERKKPFIDPMLTRIMRGPLQAQGQPPRGTKFQRQELRDMRHLAVIDSEAAQPTVRVHLRLDEAARHSLELMGIKTYGRPQGFASASIPIERLSEISDMPGIVSMHAIPVVKKELDVSRVEVRSTSLATTYAATGKGVILGDIDTGADWRNPDFIKPDGNTRIKYLWTQEDNTCVGTPPAPPFDFGCVYTEADINAALHGGPAITAPDADGHGSTTLGTAAGNGRNTGHGFPAGRYVGMAPEADLIMVKVLPEPDNAGCNTCYDISAGLDFIDAMAASLGEPYSVNLSLGSHLGGHDGTDPDEITIDTLTGPGIPGKVVSKSAGNERGAGLHISGTVSNGTTVNHTFTIPAYTPLGGTFNDVIAWQVYYTNGDSMTSTISDPTTAPCTGVQTVSASTGTGFHGVATTSGTLIIDSPAAANPNGSRLFDAEIDDQSGSAPCRGTWTFSMRGDAITQGGHYDAWIWVSSFGATQLEPVWAAPDNTKLISIPGTGFNSTTVAAYVTKTSWLSIDGNTYNYTPVPALGTLASFSSPGLTRDNRQKPEIAAPGWTSVATLSGDVSQDASVIPTIVEDGTHWALLGTSFAAPHVAGIYAQLLSLNRNLDAIDLRTLLTKTARTDTNTGAVPNGNWGFGKVDARAAGDLLVKAIPDLSAGTNSQSFSWTGISGASTYNAYRGDLSLKSATYYGSCLTTGLATPNFTDASTPIPAAGFFYYVTGVKDGVEGMLGFRSDGTPRPNSSPCP